MQDSGEEIFDLGHQFLRCLKWTGTCVKKEKTSVVDVEEVSIASVFLLANYKLKTDLQVILL